MSRRWVMATPDGFELEGAGIGEWAGTYEPGLLGLAPGDPEAMNDDRVGRMLDRLFDADRASLVTETVLGVVRSVGVDLAQLHNDSTTSLAPMGRPTATCGEARQRPPRREARVLVCRGFQSFAPQRRWGTSIPTAGDSSPSSPTGAGRTPSSRTGSRVTCPPGRKRTATQAPVSKTPIGSIGSSRHRSLPPAATGSSGCA